MSIKTRSEIELLANDEYKDNIHNPFFTAAPMGYTKGYLKCQDVLSSRILELETQLEEANSNFRILAPIEIMHQIENNKLKTQIESLSKVTLNDILNIIEDFKVKELPNRNKP
jgi:molecular chaperone GrpE (heat shock protein)